MSKPRGLGILFEWGTAEENGDKVLHPDEPIFSEKTAVPEVKRVVADKAIDVVTTPPPAAARVSTPKPVTESPLADAFDGVVQFLEHLAEEYDTEGKIADARLARAIKVHEDYIVIGRHKLTRKNELIGEGDEEYMTFERAQKCFAELPNEEQWTEIIDSIPGEKTLEKIENILNILFGPYHGFVREEKSEVYPLIHFWVQKKSEVTSTKRRKPSKPIAYRLTVGQYGKFDRDSHRFTLTGGDKNFLCFTRRILN